MPNLRSHPASSTADPIAEVDVYDCRVPLPQPLRVGSTTVTHRDYAVVRLRSESGLEGAAYAFARGLPLAALIRGPLAGVLRGADTQRPEEIRHRLLAAFWPAAEHGTFTAAVSAVDLALWDLLGQRAGLPLADLLGRRRSSVPVCAIGGYDPERPIDELQAEMAAALALGAQSVKIVIGADHPRTDADRLAAVRAVVGPDRLVAVDAFRSFTGLDDALRRLRRLEPADLSFVEDPFPESLAPLVADLRRRTGMSIGLGESLAGHRAVRGLIEAQAVDVVRIDATVIGGVREAMAAAALASAHGLPIATHVHPEIHVHFAAALDGLYPGGMELVPPASGIDALDEILTAPLILRDGQALVPDRPGLGLSFDWDAVRRYADA